MAVIHVRTHDTASGAELPACGLRTGSPQAAVDQAIKLMNSYPEPAYIIRIHFAGSFTDPAFADLSQLVQQHGLHLDIADC